MDGRPAGAPGRSSAMTRAAENRAHGHTAPIRDDAPFNWEDPLDLEGELTEEERMVRDTARRYAQDKLFPRVLSAYREERFDREIINEMAALGLIGATLPEDYGGAGLGYVASGLITRVLSAYREERFDREIINEMAALGLIGATLPEDYGGAGLGYVASGLITR